MTLLAEHFVKPPEWTWYILTYFFLAGLSGGSYALGALLRLSRRPGYQAAARLAFLAAFPLILACPLLLTLDLGQPLRFWHMLFDSANLPALNFKYWSPMSLGVWALSIYAAFAFVSFVEALSSRVRRLLAGGLGAVVAVLGGALGLFVAAYTGVLLSVSNQPVWSDGWPLGGLFLASGLSGAAALLVLAAGYRPQLAEGVRALSEADRYFVAIEAVLVVMFLVTVALAGSLGKLFSGIIPLLWLFVVLGLAVPVVAHTRTRPILPLITSLLVLVGVLALRAAVIFGAQS
ncbi:MAG: polysulfide reductase [Chloroflexi bacterium]|nr:MAG: polysulfide reductase [Chloroflexota bacterium]TME16541.1 MAG: polysulfide reductase [Chloroflexota bacterium]